MTLPQFQQFQLGNTFETVCVTTIPDSNGDNSYFVSLQDIQDCFPNAWAFKLDGVPIPFLEDSNGNRVKPLCISYHPNKTIEVTSETPESAKMTELQIQAFDKLGTLQRDAEAIIIKKLELYDYPIPRLFVIQPVDQANWDPLRVLENKCRIFFLCECGEHTIESNKDSQHQIHIAKHEGYEIRDPTQFYYKYGKYILILLQILQTGVDITDGLVSIEPALTPTVGNPGIDYAISYIDALSVKNPILDNIRTFDEYEALEGADFQQLEKFLQINNKNRRLGNLYRIMTDSGHAKWVCLDHYQSTCNEKDQKAFEEVVKVDGGKYDLHIGKVTIVLGSRTRAKEFFDLLVNTKHVYELDIEFGWETNKTDIELFKETLKRTRISILRLDLRSFQYNFIHRPPTPSTQYDIIVGFTELDFLKVVHIDLPLHFIKLYDLRPKRPTSLHKLSYRITTIAMRKGAIHTLIQLLNTNTYLTALDSIYESFGDKGATAISEALKSNTTLTFLRLANNEIGKEGAIAISKALKTNTTLTSLDLDWNSIGNEGVIAISEALNTNTALTTLILSLNNIGNEGATAMSEALKTNAILTTLNVYSNTIENAGAMALSEALKINTTLTTLNLSKNLIGKAGAIAISEALGINTALTTLDLSQNSFRNEGTIAMSHALKINTTLTTLDLEYNLIENEGVIAISEALKTNTTLTTLDLSKNSINKEGVIALSDALKSNTALTTLDLSDNSIGDEGAIAMSEALKINTTVTTLNLKLNTIKKEGAIAMSEALKINTTLITLDLRSNMIGEEGEIAMSEARKFSPRLTIKS